MVKDYLKAGRVHLALGTVSFILLGMTYLDQLLPLKTLAFCIMAGFFTTLGVFSFNVVTDLEEDKINKPDSIIVSGRKTPGKILAFSLACKAAALAAAFFLGWAVFTLVAAIVLVSFLYSYKFLKFGRFKNFFIIKNMTVALAHAAILWIPVFASGIGAPSGFWLLVFFVFLQALISNIMADLRDISGDEKYGIRTIPTAIGRSGTLYMLIFLNTVSFLEFMSGLWFWELKPYLMLLSWVCIWRYYTILVIYENKTSISVIYNTMSVPTYIVMGLLAVTARIASLCGL